MLLMKLNKQTTQKILLCFKVNVLVIYVVTWRNEQLSTKRYIDIDIDINNYIVIEFNLICIKKG